MAVYTVVESSGRLCRVLGERLSPWRARAIVMHGDGMTSLPFQDGAFDRYMSSYVLDGCTAVELARGLGEAHRILVPGGLLCALVVAAGSRSKSQFAAAAWNRLHDLDPRIVGNSRAMNLAERLDAAHWQLELAKYVETGVFASTLVVAAKRQLCLRQ